MSPTIPPPTGYTSCLVPFRTAPDDVIGVWHAAEVACAEEIRPGEAHQSLETYAAWARTLPSQFEDHSFAAMTDDGEAAGSGYCYWVRGENPHTAWGFVCVLPDHRGRGLGRHLLSQVLEAAAAGGRTTVLFQTWDVAPAGERFARAVGAKPGRVQRESELDLAAVDRAMVRDWVDAGPARAPGYELVWREGPYPEDELEPIAHAHNAMNLAPLDDLPLEDRLATPERLRENDASMVATGEERWEYLARHEGDDRFAGFTNVFWQQEDLTIVHQGGTAVWTEHRGHALGKWLKAAMLQRIFERRPDARIVRTTNAYSNDAMLGINNALGFTVVRSCTDNVVDIATARERLAACD